MGMESYIEGSCQRVEDLVRADVVVEEYVLAMFHCLGP